MRVTEFEQLFIEDEPSPKEETSNINITKQKIKNEMKRNAYKSNFLFDPDAKVSVKRRIEAFERAILKSHRKTGSLEKEKNSEKAIVQKLARRSVEKAKKILLAKQKKETQMMTSQVTLQTISKYSSIIKAQAIIHSIF